MSSLGIFIYGVVVTAFVVTALALLAWGIVNERRDRGRPEQARRVFGDRAGAYVSRGGPMQARRRP